MNLIALIIYFVWLLLEILLNRLMRSKEKDKKGSDKNSLLVIWLTIFICIPLAFYISNLYHFKIFATTTLNIGLAIIILGIFLRLIIIKSLGIFFTVDVTIKQNHTLRKDGFYKYLRHPSYFASLISFIGFGISLNNWISLSIIVIATFCAFLYRIRVEEKALIAYFGIEYLVYKKSTKTIIPFIY